MISVIIPTLNEAARVPRLLAALDRQDTPHEVIVVDGYSRDRTAEIAASLGMQVILAAPGRGRQLHAGTVAAHGDILLFLHADSVLAPHALHHIERALAADPQIVGGNFRLVFDGDAGFSRWLTGFYAWLRRHRLYYGDSGIFVRRQVYERLGGITPIALMEDYEFTRRLERSGRTCCIEDPPLMTSSRRFEGRHPAAIVLRWLAMHALFHIGVAPDRLATIYDSAREKPAAMSRH